MTEPQDMNDTEDLEVMLGDPKKAIRSMLIPILVQLLVVQANVFADTYWVSGLGIDQVSGITTQSPLYLVFSVIGLGLSVGIQSTVAFSFGRKDGEYANILAGNMFTFSLAISAVCSAVMFVLMDPLIDLMGAQDVRSHVHDYIMPFILLSPAVISVQAIGGLMRGEGLAKRQTVMQISAQIQNIVLDPVFIYGLDMGVRGAAVATVVQALIQIAVGLQWYLRGTTAVRLGFRYLRIRTDALKDLLSIAVPRAAESLVGTIGMVFERMLIIISGGTVGVALYNVPFKYVQVAQCPADSAGMALIPVAAAAYGGNDRRKMKEALDYTLKIGVGVTAVLSVAMFVLSAPLISLFTAEESMSEWNWAFLWNMRAYCILLPLYAVQVVYSSILQAVKRQRISLRLKILLELVKLGLFGIASYYDFKAITVALIVSYVISAAVMYVLAGREFVRIQSGMPD